MRRALVWGSCGLAVVTLGVFVTLRVAAPQHPTDAPSAAGAVATAPATPALPLDPPLAPPSASGGLDPRSSPAPRAPGAAAIPPGGSSAAATLDPTAVAADRAAAMAEHEQRRVEHRKAQTARAKAKHEEVKRRSAERHQARLAWEATRAPDPNRPPVERPHVKLGPPIRPAPGASQPSP